MSFSSAAIEGMERGCGTAVSVEGRLKVTRELREQTGPGNPQPPQRESTVTVKNPQTRLDEHARWVDRKSKEQGWAAWGGSGGRYIPFSNLNPHFIYFELLML